MRTAELRRLYHRSKVLGFIDEPMLSVYRDRGVVLKDEATNHNKTAEDRSIYQLVDNGWLVVNRMKAWQGSLGISTLRGIVSGHYICFEPMHDEFDRYLHYALRAPHMTAHFASISRGVRPGQIEIDNDDLAATKVRLPDIDEQRQIADFLDDRVDRIDRIISARREQVATIARVREARMQQLHDELTGKFGDSRLGHLIVGLEQGWSPQAEAAPAGYGEWGVMRSGSVNGGRFRPEDNKRLPEDLKPRVEYELRAGDLLMSRASGSLDLIGSVAVVPAGVRPGLLLCDKIYRIHPGKAWKAEFLAHMMRTRNNRDRIRLGASGAEGMANNLPSGVVRELRIPLVPSERQANVLEEADAIVRRELDGAVALNRSLELLTEYKFSLITAAVTGELDVTTAGSGVPA